MILIELSFWWLEIFICLVKASMLLNLDLFAKEDPINGLFIRFGCIVWLFESNNSYAFFFLTLECH